MRRFLSLLVVCAGCVWTQSGVQSEDSPEIARAKAGIEKLRTLVEAGAAPRKQLERAEAALADSEDAAFVRKTVYGPDLTEGQTDDMLAAATRRVDRRKNAVADMRRLVEEGVASRLALTPVLEELDTARKEYDLAESRARFVKQMGENARAEEALESSLNQSPEDAPVLADRYDGDGVFSMVAFSKVESEFEKHFGKPLPVSAMGDTAVHRSMGFDHRGRVDVALNPDQPEGHWLLEYLVQNHIPYFAFRHAVPGKATGAHIHLGPMSTRFKLGG
ncbi:MAG TPA: hypothetical protein VNV86_21675 [Candidatus Acidoferrum sp.]|nr:hypothetical protein [Candidatus Acidoferrum sp.]